MLFRLEIIFLSKHLAITKENGNFVNKKSYINEDKNIHTTSCHIHGIYKL